jgi:hypothetical protein
VSGSTLVLLEQIQREASLLALLCGFLPYAIRSQTGIKLMPSVNQLEAPESIPKLKNLLWMLPE